MDDKEALELVERTNEMLDEVEGARTVVYGAVAIGALVGLGVGIFVGYKVATSKLQAKYELELEEQIAEAKAFYGRLHKVDTPTPESALKQLRPEVAEAAEALSQYRGDPNPEPEIPEVRVEVEVTNVFDGQVTDTWDQEAEEEYRSTLEPGQPYIISEDEYQQEGGIPQQTLTWYEGDKVLADERDEHIPTVEATVGLENLQRFGHGTGDARTVFIRNPRLKVDFEVLKHDGSYAHEVLGLQHSDGYDRRDGRRPIRRMRNDE